MVRSAMLLALIGVIPAFADSLPGTQPLETKGDLAAKMVAGIDAYLMRELAKAPSDRANLPKPTRERLRQILGVTEWPTAIPDPEVILPVGKFTPVAETDLFRVVAIRWQVIPGITGEGLWLEPKGKAIAQVIAIPDADQTPEDLAGLTNKTAPEGQLGRLLAEKNVRVIIPAIINRDSKFSKSEVIQRTTTQPHREFLYRMAYEMGRHLIGYEVQRVVAAIDVLSRKDNLPIGLVGFGDGGLIALYTAALDERVKAVASIANAGPLPTVWKEPIDRNVWSVVKEFGLGGLGELLAPRGLSIGYNHPLKKIGRVPNSGQGLGATPGDITPITLADVQIEWKLVEAAYTRSKGANPPKLIDHTDTVKGAELSLNHLLSGLALSASINIPKTLPPLTDSREKYSPDAQQFRLFNEILIHVQKEWRESEPGRFERFAKLNYKTPEAYAKAIEPARKYFDEEVIGKLPAFTEKPNPKSRVIYDTEKFKGYEVTLDLYPDVFAYGILLLPKDLKPGEKRPVVVCQHGLEGRPTDVCDPTKKTPYYNSFGAQLANLGYIVFAPQNPYIGRDDFRVLQRKANPLKLSLFSFINRQHELILDWLATLPQVQGDNIGFYGLSYGGKTAVRVPAVLTKYKFSICSGDFNEWVGKNVSVLYRNSYMFTGEYEMYEFNLGKTFNYAEMAYLIAPRPFMVERGHDDGVGSDEMVSYEFAKVRYHYAKRLGIGNRTKIEYFVGGHEIHSGETFDFIAEHTGYKPKK